MKIGSAITNLHVDSYSPYTERAAIGWEKDGYRFHIWIYVHPTDRTNWSPEGDYIYKNPPVGTPHRGPGDFPTRQLDRTKKVNEAIYREVATFVNEHGLIAKAIAAEAEKVAAEQRAQDEAARIYVIQEAGVDLYEALKLVRECYSIGGLHEQHTIERIEAAIAKAEGRA